MKIQVLSPKNSRRDLFLTPKSSSALEAAGTVAWNLLGRQYTQEELVCAVREADVLVTGWDCPRITAKTVKAAGRCPGLIAHMGGTVAPYIEPELYSMGLRTVSANDIFAKSVAEGTVADILASLRDIPYWNAEVQAGRWRPDDHGSRSLSGKKIGLVGYGTITRYLIPLLRAFETDIWLYSGHMTPEACAALGVRKAELAEIFAECDVISLHCSLTDKTHHLVNAGLLRTIRDGALFVNTARAGVIDTQALEEELKKGRFNAVLDVFDEEPLPEGSALRGLCNVILTPHMAGPAADLYEPIGMEMVREIERWRDGLPLRYEIGREEACRMTAKG